MAEQITAIDVIVPTPVYVLEVIGVGVQGPPGPPGSGGGSAGPHAATHQPGGADPMAVDAGVATGSLRTIGTGITQAASGADPRLTNARVPTAHATTHQPGGSDALVVDAAAGTGSLRTLGTGATQAAAGTDARFTNTRTPTAHAASHTAGNSDPVTVTALAGYPGGNTTFLRADGTFAAPATGGGAHAATHYVGGADALAGSLAATDVRVGVNPAQTGAVRLANNTAIMARNTANDGDVPIATVVAGDTIVYGQTGAAAAVAVVRADTLLLRSNNYGFQNLAAANLYGIDENQFYPFGSKSLGLPNNRWVIGHLNAINLKETTSPGAAAADSVNIWLEDNGAGKSRLMVQFATGAAIQLAIQP